MSACPSCGFAERPATGPCPLCGATEPRRPRQEEASLSGSHDSAPTQPAPGSSATSPASKMPTAGFGDTEPIPVGLRPGSVLAGTYEIQSELGHGAFGVVYLARDRDLDKQVAVKVLKCREFPSGTDQDKARERFLREARALARLDGHNNIVRVIKFGDEDGVPYFVMEYLGEGSLADLLKKGPLSPRRAAELVADVASALVEVHAHETIHRDIKPANIFLRRSRGVLGDFGIAYVTDLPRITSGPLAPGTAQYMSPERLAGDGADNRSDLFSLGCVLYEALTGQVLFQAPSQMEVLGRIVSPSEVDLGPFEGLVPAPLMAVLRKSLAKKAPERYQSAARMEADLRAFVNDSTAEEAARRRKRRLGGIAAGGGAVALGAILVITLAPDKQTRGGAKPAAIQEIQADPKTPPPSPANLLAQGKARSEEAWQSSGTAQVRLCEEAIRLLTSAVEADPNLADAFFERGITQQLIYEVAGMAPEVRQAAQAGALADLKRACDLNPQHPAYCERARFLGALP